MDGTPATVTFTSGGQVQTYTFNISSQPQKISIQITNSTLTSTSLVLKDPDGANVINSTSFGASYFSDALTLTKTGQYSIVLTAGSTSTGSLTLQGFTFSDQSGGMLDYSGAGATTAGVTANVNITSPGQNATFQFTANAGDLLNLDTNSNMCGWTDLNVQFPSGAWLFHQQNNVFAESPWWTYQAWWDRALLPETGTYTIWFNPDSYACANWTGTTSFTIWKTHADVDNPIKLNGPSVSDVVYTPGQYASVHFGAGVFQPIKWCVGGPFGGWDTVYVTDPNGFPIGNGVPAYSIANCATFLTDGTAGTYHLLLDPWRYDTGTYPFTVYALGPPMPQLATLFGADGTDPSAWTNDPVNSETGVFSLQETDLRLPGVGVPFKLTRSYSSAASANGPIIPGPLDTNNYSSRVAALNPNNYWRLDEASGTSATDSGSALQNLTYSNATLGVAGATADADTAASFAGTSSSKASNGSAPSAAVQNFTMEAWVYPTAASSDGVILAQGPQNGYNGYRLELTASGGCNAGLVVDVGAGNVTCGVFGSANVAQRTLPLNQWAFVAVTRDSSGVWTLYINGNQIAQVSGATPYAPCNTQTSSSTCSGNSTVVVGTGFAGRIDEPAFFVTALTGNQIRSQIGYPAASTMTSGWQNDYDIRAVKLSNNDVILRGEGGQQIYYASNGDGTYSAPMATSTLTDYNGGWKLVRKDQTTLVFNSSGQLTSEVDRDGNGLSFSYTGGLMTQVTDSVGRAITFTYTNGLLTQVSVPDGRSVSYSYSSGHLATVTDARGKTWTYAYNGAGQLVSEQNPLGNYGFRNTYDANTGRVTQTQDALGNATTYAWNAGTGTATMTDPAGKQWKDIYANNLLSKRIAPLGETTTYTFNNQGENTTITDARNNTTTMTYDAAGNMLTRVGPAPFSVSETWTYNSRNDITSYKDGRGNTTGYGYDANGNLTSVTKPGNLTTTYGRDPTTHELVTSVADPRNKTTNLTYDATTKLLTSSTSPLGNKTTYGYDSAGRENSVTDPRGNVAGCNCASQYTTTATYNPAGNVLSETDPLGHQTTYTYDDVGLLKTVTNDQLKTWTYDYNAANERLKETAPDGNFTTADYDSRGNLIKTTSATGSITTYGYDDDNRKVSQVSPRGNVAGCNCASQFTWTYGYDANGNRTSTTNPLGNTTNYTYDELNRISTITTNNTVSNYAPLTLGMNPAAYWRMGESSGTTMNDASGNGRTGTYNGSPTLGASGAVVNNTAVSFNGSSQYAEVPYSAALNPSTFTVEAWVYLTGGQGSWRSVLSSRNYTTVGSGYTIYATSSNTWALQLGNGTSSWVQLNGPAVTLNKWTFLVGTFDGTTGRLYVDGTLAASSSVSFVANSAKPLRIATGAPEGSPQFFFPGKIDDVAVFPSALSASQISSQLTEQQRGVRTTTYKYDAAGDTTNVIDPAGNSTGYGYDAANRLTTKIAYGVPPLDLWRLDEASGATVAGDLGTAGKTLSYSNATLGANGATSDGNSAASFSGATGSRATNAAVMSTLTSSFTISAWIYPTASNQHATIFYNGNINSNGYGLMMSGASGASGNTLTVMAGGVSWDVLNNFSSRTLPLNQWTFAALTRDASGSWSLYLNGNSTAVATGTANPGTPAATSTAGTWIGGATGSSGTNYYFNGRVDEPSFYAKALTGTQVQQIYQQAGGLNRITSNAFDGSDNVIKTVDPTGGITTFAYDDDNQLTTITDPLGNVQGGTPSEHQISYTYDPVGNKTAVTDQMGRTTSYGYNPVNLLTSATDANGNETTHGYNDLNQLTSVVDGLGNTTGGTPADHTTSYAYDQVGNLITRTDAKGHTTTFGYDADHRLTSKQSQLGSLWTYSYDADGNQTQTIDANAHAAGNNALGTTTYSYDNADRLSGISYSDSTPSVSYSYDPFGDRISMTDGAGTANYSYDADGNLLSSTRGSNVFNYSYDSFSDVLSRTYPDSTATNYTYDGAGRMLTAASGGNTTMYGYDAVGHLMSTTLPNGYIETRTYDRAGWLASLTNAKNGSTLSSFSFTRDNVGNPTQIATQSGTERYTYDADNRLTESCYQASVCTGGSDPFIRWTYDAVGNRTSETRPTDSTTYTYNGDDQLTSSTNGSGTTNYTYDADGQLAAAGSSSFSYSVAGLVTSATVGSTTSNYSYDGDGNRLSQTVGSATTNYLWDANFALPQLARESDGSGSLIRRHLYGLDRISMTTPDGDYYYVYDGQGNVANLTSSTGATEWTYTYEPGGNPRSAVQNDPSAPANPIQFAGEYLDASTSVYNLRVRQYDATSGRFLATDPIAPSTSDPAISSYLYAGDNPLIGLDPSGMSACTALFGNGAFCGYVHMVGSAINSVGEGFINGIEASINDVYSCLTGGDFRLSNRHCLKALLAVVTFAIPGMEADEGIIYSLVRLVSEGRMDEARALLRRLITVERGPGGGASLPYTRVRPLKNGENPADIENELKARTWVSGDEHVVIVRPDGSVELGKGGPGGISDIPGTVIVHTHPDASPPSPADFAAATRQGHKMWVISVQTGEVWGVPPGR